ncbi:MAG TPA: glycosyltransferase [Anaerolineales bacterium]|jgi:glycosyltransferase involved in cell wall biosynthesis
MRILHVTPAYYPAIHWGGPIFSVYGLNKGIAVFPDVELRVLTTDAAGPRVSDRLDSRDIDFESLYPDYTVYFMRRIAGDSVSPGLLIRLPALIRWADVVHLTAVYSFPTFPTLILSLLHKKPLIWSPSGSLLEINNYEQARKKGLKRVWNAACNYLLRFGNVTLHTTSRAEMTASLNQLPDARAMVIRHGTELSAQPPARSYLRDGKLRLLFIGRLHPIKGIEKLLEAVKVLDDPTISLSICGDGDPQYVLSLKERARQLGLLETVVHFSGRVEGEAKRAAFLDADVCVFPSHSENFGIVVAESLAHAVPVIVSHGMPWQDVEDRRCGLWVENSPEELARAIRSMRRMDLAAMGSSGWKWMNDEFSWDSISREMLAAYKAAVQKKGLAAERRA